MKRYSAFLLVLVVAVGIIFVPTAISESSSEATSFVFLGEITWNSTLDEVDQVMSSLGIQRHSSFRYHIGVELTEGKNDQYRPYANHNIMGGSGSLIGFTTGENLVGLERITMSYEPSSIGFMNVYRQLCAHYGENYRFGMLTSPSGYPNMSAYVWETGDANIILYVVDFANGCTGQFNRAENGLCGFDVEIYHHGFPDNLVFQN